MKLREFFLILCVVALVAAYFQSAGSPGPPVGPKLTMEVVGHPERLEQLVLRARLTSENPMRVIFLDGAPMSDISFRRGEVEWPCFGFAPTPEKEGELRLFSLSVVRPPVDIGRDFSWEIRPAELFCYDRDGLEESFGKVSLSLKLSVSVGSEETDSPMTLLAQSVVIPPSPPRDEEQPPSEVRRPAAHSTSFRVKEITKSAVVENEWQDVERAANAGYATSVPLNPAPSGGAKGPTTPRARPAVSDASRGMVAP